MTLTINLLDEQRDALTRRAAELGVSVEDYAARIIESDLEVVLPKPSSKTPEQRAEDFAAWASSHPYTPPLSDEAISRESMYPDRG